MFIIWDGVVIISHPIVLRKETPMYDAKDYYYDDEHSKTTAPNTVKNNQAVNFTFYFYYKYNLPLTTSTNIKDLNEVFFLDGSVSWPGGALTKLCRILEENNITYKEYFGAISVTKEDLYTLIAYIKMQGEWRDQWKYFK